MEYIDPNDKYDVGVFNRNFKEIEDAINEMENAPSDGRPADWLELPDISNAKIQTFVALVHLGEDENNTFAFKLIVPSTFTEEEQDQIVVDWGDGTVQSAPSTVSGRNFYFTRKYDFDTINAPTTSDGKKQVIVTLTNNADKKFTTVAFSVTEADQIEGERFNTNHSLLKELHAQLVSGNINVHVENCKLRALVLWNAYAIYANYCTELENIYCKRAGEMHMLNIENSGVKDVTIDVATRGISNVLASNSSIRHLKNSMSIISDKINFDNSDIEELVLNKSVRNKIGVPNLENCCNLKKLILNGWVTGFVLTGAPMTREAIVNLFNSLGTATSTLTDEEKTIDLTTLLSYTELTEDDKDIARNKGFIVP